MSYLLLLVNSLIKKNYSIFAPNLKPNILKFTYENLTENYYNICNDANDVIVLWNKKN